MRNKMFLWALLGATFLLLGAYPGEVGAFQGAQLTIHGTLSNPSSTTEETLTFLPPPSPPPTQRDSCPKYLNSGDLGEVRVGAE